MKNLFKFLIIYKLVKKFNSFIFLFLDKYILSLSFFYRFLILVFGDLFINLTSVIFSYWFLSGSNLLNISILDLRIFVLIYLLTSLVIYYFTGQYKGLTKYSGSDFLYSLVFRNTILSLITFLLIKNQKIDFDFRFLLLIWMFSTSLMVTSRFFFKDILLGLQKKDKKKLNVIIYGAGSAGAQLASSLKLSGEHNIKAFVDDSSKLWNRNLYGIPIKDPKSIVRYKNEIDQIILAIPSLSIARRKKILIFLQRFSIKILQLPPIEKLLSGDLSINNLLPINSEQLLGRDPVKANYELLQKSIKGLVVCVIGSGGSIGSELCKQIVKFSPKILIMLDISELNLYKLDETFSKLEDSKILIKSILGDAKDLLLLKNIFSKYKVDIVFHTAAYKHVPIVENNPIQGLYNNILTTYSVCEAARLLSLKQMIYISTDKAVRPSNVMGASKRVSEIIVQSFAEINQIKTIYSMVRFGNVLGSSGSVVNLFKKQIENGGPVTLTDKKIIRYFMTIKEAVQLVLQSSVLASGGELFLLDMGKPVLIKDLAEQMIRLSGLSIRDKENPNGDIEIITTGLRPGEKLFEEMLIDAKAEVTSHPLIYRAKEKYLYKENVFDLIRSLIKNLEIYDKKEVFSILNKLVPEWKGYHK